MAFFHHEQQQHEYLFVVFCLITATVEQSLATIDFAINTRAAANLMSWHVAGRSYSILSAFARLAYSTNICRSSSLYSLLMAGSIDPPKPSLLLTRQSGQGAGLAPPLRPSQTDLAVSELELQADLSYADKAPVFPGFALNARESQIRQSAERLGLVGSAHWAGDRRQGAGGAVRRGRLPEAQRAAPGS